MCYYVKNKVQTFGRMSQRETHFGLVLQVFSIWGVQNRSCAELKRTAYEIMISHHEEVAINAVVLNYLAFMPQFTPQVFKTAIITT